MGAIAFAIGRTVFVQIHPVGANGISPLRIMNFGTAITYSDSGFMYFKMSGLFLSAS